MKTQQPTVTIYIVSRSEISATDKAKMMTWFEKNVACAFQVSFRPMNGPFYSAGYIAINGLSRGGRGTKLAKKAAEYFYDIIQFGPVR